MASNVDKARRPKRRQVTSGCNGSSAKSPVDCYITRGLLENEWHVWNTSPGALKLRSGDTVHTRVVTSDFDGSTVLLARVLADVNVPGSGAAACVLGRDMCFTDNSLEQFGDLRSVATQVDFVDMCMSKGVKCTSFLEHYTQNPDDEELRLGSRVCSLFVHTVREMLSRRYDIMHHYPLYNRVLGLHYADGSSSEPPEMKDVIATGGLLDRSAADHQSLHGISLVGLDHVTFSQWNYPDNREDLSEEEPEPNVKVDTSDKFIVNTVEAFNNLPGTLTDRPRAFPYLFTVRPSNELTFDDLVQYCQVRTREPLGSLPSREAWGSVNPVLLMEDPVDPETGKTMRRYTVTSRGHLSTIGANRDVRLSLCYNEVFLPNRPVSRLNLDVDLKCCQRCNTKFATQADRSTKRKVSEAMTTSLILVIVESLLRFVKVKTSELECNPSLKELAKSVGKIAVYTRESSVKSKLSLRMLWYLPVELCSFEGIEAYRPLLDEMEKTSLNYVLLSYPSNVQSCGLCDLADAMRTGGCSTSGSRFLRLNSDSAENRSSSIDKAPYSLRKSVRLPNCDKEDSGFEYVDTFNRQDIEDPGFDDPLSLSVGLSSNPILVDVTSLGIRFQGILKVRGYAQPPGIFGLDKVPDQARVESEARRLASLWGVPVTVRTTGSGLFCVQANEKSTTYPCPIHNRVHSKSKLGALVFATNTKPKCFVA
ncbi:hypothetical protein DPEC_G00067750 [Dallia pectoralis]|uniref:Uncharacterized protein n=1 Tax=Dallia pectoralis TaxID=75939 RepID=A0ACC2H156_DALPE|nr:hypothetical protein DPEC_G00067750 [Dallia pectoralis]